MKKLTVLVEISVADNVAELYPNYNYNYRNEQEFIDSLIDGIETPYKYEDVFFGNSLKQYGYSIRVLSRDEAKLIDL